MQVKEKRHSTGISLALDCWPTATLFDPEVTWFGILLTQTYHLKFCKLVLGPKTLYLNPVSACTFLNLRNKNRSQLVFKSQKNLIPVFFSEISFNLGHLNLNMLHVPSECSGKYSLSLASGSLQTSMFLRSQVDQFETIHKSLGPSRKECEHHRQCNLHKKLAS